MNLNKDPERWRRLSAKAVMAGSTAQGENVLRMAIEDILRLSVKVERYRRAAIWGAGVAGCAALIFGFRE